MSLKLVPAVIESGLVEEGTALSSLKVGDSLLVSAGGGMSARTKSREFFRVVAKVLPTRLVDDQGDAWLFNGGKRVGDMSRFNAQSADPLTRRLYDRYRVELFRNRALSELGSSELAKRVNEDPAVAEAVLTFLMGLK